MRIAITSRHGMKRLVVSGLLGIFSGFTHVLRYVPQGRRRSPGSPRPQDLGHARKKASGNAAQDTARGGGGTRRAGLDAVEGQHIHGGFSLNFIGLRKDHKVLKAVNGLGRERGKTGLYGAGVYRDRESRKPTRSPRVRSPTTRAANSPMSRGIMDVLHEKGVYHGRVPEARCLPWLLHDER
jgi:hypothetical protein